MATQKRSIKGKEKLQFGTKDTIMVDVDLIIDKFVTTIFGFDLMGIQEANEIAQRIPTKEGTIKEVDQKKSKEGLSGTTTAIPLKDNPEKTSGGIKSLLDLFIRFYYKIVGFFFEAFSLMITKPLLALVNDIISNQDFLKGKIPNSYGNATPLSNVAYLTQLSSVPATAAAAAISQAAMLKNQVTQIKILTEQILKPMTQFLTDTQNFVTKKLLGDSFKNFTIPIPKVGLGVMGISIPAIDMNSLFKKDSSPLGGLSSPADKTSFATSIVNFLKNMFLFPINILIDYVKKFVDVIKNLISLSVAEALGGVEDLIKSFIPTINGIKSTIKKILNPFILPFIAGLIAAYTEASKLINDPKIKIPDIGNLFNALLDTNKESGTIIKYRLGFNDVYETIPNKKAGAFDDINDVKKFLNDIFKGLSPIFDGLKSSLNWFLLLIDALIGLLIYLNIPIGDKILDDIGKEIPILKPVVTPIKNGPLNELRNIANNM